jgi:hypothetical protein
LFFVLCIIDEGAQGVTNANLNFIISIFMGKQVETNPYQAIGEILPVQAEFLFLITKIKDREK